MRDAIQVGQAAQEWLAQVERTLGECRWIDHDTIERLRSTRPQMKPWQLAAAEPRLASAYAWVVAESAQVVNTSQAVDLDAWARAHNDAFFERERCDLADFFRTIESSPLTNEQMKATVCFDNRVRVIAAAGSGKTSTLVARAGYAIARGIARPEQILALAFNQKAARELSERMAARLGVDGRNISACTFHAFGLRVIGEATGRKPSLAPDLDVDNGMARLATIVDDLLKYNQAFRRDWQLFRWVFGRNPDDSGSEKGNDRRLRPRLTTMAGQFVRSQEEQMIANWLYLNGVEYEYERPFVHDLADAHHRQYQPDFYYPSINAWHEHWAIGSDGLPLAEFEGYVESMQWRKHAHTTYGTTLIETTSASIRDGTGFDHLARELQQRGVSFREVAEHSSAAESPMSGQAMLALVRQFMVHAKGNRLSSESLDWRARSSQRSQIFIRLYELIASEWNRQLGELGQVDFDDMLNLATDHIESQRWHSPYRVVMVDEMQDSSAARAQLIRALSSVPGTFLYAVGDDWQGINRFAGADATIMSNFDQWFGVASTVTLSRTFRSPQTLCNIAATFVMKNPCQLAKQVQSSVREYGGAVLALSVRHRGGYDRALQDYLRRLDAELGQSASVLVLGRYHANAGDVRRALSARYLNLEVTYNTVHASKGKEADYIVIIGMERGAFPDTHQDDPLLDLVMAAPDRLPHAEERRLFYVALTRARRNVLLLTRTGHESPFVLELVADGAVTISSLVGRDVTPVVCPTCQQRAMVVRTGRFGTFLGCSGYPACDGTRRINQSQIATRV